MSNKSKTRITAALLVCCTAMSFSACGSSNTTTTTASNAASTSAQATQAQVNTENGESTEAEKTAEETTTAATTIEEPSIFSSYAKVDEIYNTNFEPNISDDVTFEIEMLRKDDWDGTYWRDNIDSANDTYKVPFDNNMSYNQLISKEGFELTSITDVYSITINQDAVSYNRDTPKDFKYEFNGIHHIPTNYPISETNDIFKTKLYAPIIIEIADVNGNIAENISPSNDYRVKAIGSTLDNSSFILKFSVKNTNNETIDIMAGEKYNGVKNKLSKMFEGADILMHIDSNTKYLVLKNNNYTLFIERNVRDSIESVMLINNNV